MFATEGLASVDNDLKGDVPNLKVLLNGLVERGLLAPRTRGSMRTHGNHPAAGVTSRDSLDGSTAVLANYVNSMKDSHPITSGRSMDVFLFGGIPDEEGPGPEEDAPEAIGKDEDASIQTHKLLTFSSYVHQEVGLHGLCLRRHQIAFQRNPRLVS